MIAVQIYRWNLEQNLIHKFPSTLKTSQSSKEAAWSVVWNLRQAIFYRVEQKYQQKCRFSGKKKATWESILLPITILILREESSLQTF